MNYWRFHDISGGNPRRFWALRVNGKLKGFRYVEVRQRRTAVDYAQFMQNLVQKHYPHVEYIRLVQDNLNTHTSGSFYEVLAPEDAFDLSQQFDLHYTPKKARG